MQIPENFTLQYSDTFGNINHRGNLASNVSATTIVTTFPTTSTGTSLGHYHFTDPTTNALKLINFSSGGTGGHQFWHSNSTQPPLKLFDINRSGVIVDTKIANTSNSLALNFSNSTLTINNVIQSPISSVIVNPSPFYYGTNTGPSTSPVILEDYGYSGWYYQYSSDIITWSFPVRINTTVADLKGISVHFFNVNANFSITINTTGSTGSTNYTLPTLATNTSYQGVAILSPTQVPNNETTVALQSNASIGTYLQTSPITNVVISTSGATGQNEFVISKLNIHYVDVVTSYLLN